MILAIVQARMGSTRLPGKVLKEVCGKSLIEILLNRLSRSKKIDKIILATSEKPENDLLAETVEKLGFEVFRGNDKDVLNRYYQAAKQQHPDIVVRVTGDCPLIDPNICDRLFQAFLDQRVDYAELSPDFAEGADCEILTFKALEEAYHNAVMKSEREHVTLYINNHHNYYILIK